MMKDILKWIWVSPVMTFLMPGLGSAMEPGIWTAELANGMRVVLVEDHSSALAASVVCIRAGSRTETLPNNGMSHLLEHLLFDGTSRHTRASLQEAVLSEGGYFNAFTRKDYVSFEIVMPSEAFGTGLELQAEQLLESVIPPDELAKERKVVCEEIAKDFNDPGSAAEDVLMRMLFGSSGYGLPVIGNYHTVETVSRDEIVRFYKSRYNPSQMTAVIVGDIDPQAVLQKLRSLYGSVPAGPAPKGIRPAPNFPEPAAPVVHHADVRSETMLIAFPAPPADNPDSLLFQAAVTLWSGGRTSPLQKALTGAENPLAADAGAWVADYDGFSLLEVSIEPAADTGTSAETRAKQLLRAVQSSLETFLSGGIDAARLKRIVKQMYVDHRFAAEKFHHRARDIAHYDALGALEQYFAFDERLKEIDPAAVSAVAEKYLKDAVPAAVFVVPDVGKKRSAETSATGPSMKVLSNGLRVIALHDSYAPLMAYHLLIPAVGTPPAGVPRFTAEMLDRGTKDMTAEQIEAALTEHGIRVKLADNPWMPFDNYYNSPEYNYLRMESLSGDAEEAMRLLRAMAFESVFPDAEMDAVRRKLSMISARDQKSASHLSARALEGMMFPGSVFSRPMIPPPAGVMSITSEQLRTYHAQAYTPENCLLGIVGNRSLEEMFDLAERYLGDLTGPSPSSPPPYTTGSVRRITVAAPSEQAYVRAAVVPEIAPEELPVLDVLAELLSDKLQGDIREKKGMAYRLGAYTSPRKGCTVLEIGIGTRKNNVPVVESAARALIDAFRRERPDGKAVHTAVNSLKGHALRYRQRRINRAYYLLWREFLGHGYTAEVDYIRQLSDVTPAAVEKLLKKIPDAADWYWVVATSAESEPVEDAGKGGEPR